MTSTSSELNIFATESARRNLVTAYRKSGLSQKVFCVQHDVKESTFKNWFYRYPECSQPDAIESKLPQPDQTLDPSFLFKAITVREDVKASETPIPFPSPLKPTSVVAPGVFLEQAPPSPPTIYIDCSAFRIAVPIGFDTATLHSILSVMQTVS